MRKQYCLLSIAFLTLLVTAAIILFTGCSDNKPNAKNQEYTAKNAFKLESETRSENDTTPANEPDSESDYERLWQEVEDFRSKALVKSELKRVERIRSIAKKYNNAGQFIRAVIRKIQFIEEMEKEPLIKVIKELSHELEESSFPIKPVIHSLLAQQYWEYSDDNDYRILGRTAAADVTQEDMRTWDLRKMVEVVVKHYRKSLENPAKAKATRIELYDEILIKGSGRKFRPTLYDFLAHRAIDFYMNRKSNLTQPGYRFTLNNADYFKTAKEFAALKITTREPLSFYYQALTGLQELARFHLKDKNPEALLDVELKRYRFLYRTTGLPNKDKLYEKALRKMIAKYGPAPATATLYDALAVHYWDLGPKYKKPGVPSEYKSNLKKARKLCKEAIKKYPGTTGANHCLHLINRIEAKKLDITAENAVVPGRPFPTRIAYKNIGKIYVRLVKTYREEIIDKKKLTEEQMIAYFLGKNVSWKNEIQLPYDWDYQWYSTEIKIEALEPGEYLLLISNSKTFDFETRLVTYSWITASNIAYIQRNSIKMGPEFYVVNRETGRPLPNTSARVWYFQDQYDRTPRGNKWTKGPLLRTGKNGYLNILKQFPEAKDYFYLDFSHSGHRLFTKNHFFIYNMVKQPDEKLKTFFFTDRALYRPGQTVYFKGIMVDPGRKGDEEPGLVINRPTTVVFKDVNRREIDRLRLTTGAYGTFSGTFRIPTGRLNGNMRISNNYGSQSFSVEEYKRPKFDVRFPPVKEAYKLAETVTIKGKATAYAGYKIDNANVKYRVVRSVTYPYRWCCWGYTPPAPQMEIANGVTKTNAKGEFQVKFKAIPDLTLAKANQPAFNYTVYADVTGSSGETNSGQTDISVGYIALKVGVDIPGRLDRAGGPYSFTIKTTSLSGDFLPAKGEISFFKLKENQRVCRKKLWSTPDKFVIDKNHYYTDFPHDNYAGEGDYHNWEKERRAYRGSFDTGKVKQLEMTALSKWKTGKYKMEMVSKDRYGTPVKEIRYFTLYSSKENKVPFKQLDWFVVPKKKLQPGEKALFLIGTSTREARVIYEIEQRGEIIHKQYITLRHEQKRIEFPIEEKHRGNLGFHFVFIKHNRLHRHTGIIQVPRTNKELDITFKTFRNKLRPGEKEEWRITIRGKKGPNGKPGEKVAAEMVATLYDASLDTFRKQNWGFDIYPHHSAKYEWGSNRYFNKSYCNSIGISEKTAPYIRERYDRLNWFGVPPLRGAGLLKSVGSGGGESREEREDRIDYRKEGGERGSGEPDFYTVEARTNFQETAFFYPHLKTGKDGTITLSFTVPEALTKWKMLGFAHTKDLKFGLTTNQLVTQKEMMVVPNTPRFFREGDKLELSAKIVNLSKETRRGTAKLMLFETATMQPVDKSFENKIPVKTFNAARGQSDLVTWRLVIPENIAAVTYRLVAVSGNYSDGEEQAVPILKNRMPVTETLPLPVPAGKSKEYVFKKLVNTAKATKSTTLRHHKLTLEFTTNPLWYAVQALPYLMEYPHECMEQVFSRYYANGIAAQIVKTNPKIKKVFEKWKNVKDTDALLSSLEKNRELKNIMLQDTPWVMNAGNETRRKKRIALLFDINKMAQQQGRALAKLEEGQEPSGAWSWFKGMRENRYITQHIVCGLAHMHALNVIDAKNNKRIRTMMIKAVPYLDRQIKKDYQWLIQNKANLAEMHIGNIQVHYLYARSYFMDIYMEKDLREAFDYYKKQAETNWRHLNKYMQGMIALSMNRFGNKKKAEAIVKSIKEHALYSEEMGMYWKTSSGYYWFQSPIETQALLIEVFDEILKDSESVEKMRTWLLKQKQTRDWRTTKATAEACFALLLNRTDRLTGTKPPDIILGKTKKIKIEPTKMENVKVEAGTGYFKTAWAGKDIKPDMGNIYIKNNNKEAAWGGMYWQYFEDLDKITPAKTQLHIKKQLLVEKPSDAGPVLHPLTKYKIMVGDRLKVRIELRVDRNMEYVHMKDMRASGLEPENVISRYKYQDGLSYYEVVKDASTNFFFDNLLKGTYVFEYPLRVSHAGDFSNGITTIQCMYAPEFSSHSKGARIQISGK